MLGLMSKIGVATFNFFCNSGNNMADSIMLVTVGVIRVHHVASLMFGGRQGVQAKRQKG